MKHLFLLFLFATLFYSCTTQESQPPDCVCTMEFREISVRVVDKNLTPVDSLSIIIKCKTTGKEFTIPQQHFTGVGYYTVMTDTYTQEFSTTPTSILFEATNGNASVTGEFKIGTDDCKCHIYKVSGPDTLHIAL